MRGLLALWLLAVCLLGLAGAPAVALSQEPDADIAAVLALLGEEPGDVGLVAYGRDWDSRQREGQGGLESGLEPGSAPGSVPGSGSGSGLGQSLGTPQHGRLVGARPLPPHRGYRVLRQARAFGSEHAISLMTGAFDSVVAADPGAPAVMVHDLSLPEGGPMNGHGSHQSGRDVDVMYYRHDCRGVCGARSLRPSELDAARQWRLLSRWLSVGAAEFVFIDYGLQAPLYAAAAAAGATGAELSHWFQYPRGRQARAGVIRHWPNHRNHMHVRFVCGRGEGGCRSERRGRIRRAGRTVPRAPAAAAETAWLSALDGDGIDVLELLGP